MGFFEDILKRDAEKRSSLVRETEELHKKMERDGTLPVTKHSSDPKEEKRLQ